MKAKKVILISVAIFALILSLLVLFLNHEQLNNNDVLAWVNDEPVTFGEFKVYFQRHRSDAFSYFTNKYGIEDSEDFWTKKLPNGEIPIEIAKIATLDEITRVKVEQIYMRKYGVVSDISYDDFLEKIKNENRDRETKVKNGQAIYGPKQYSEVDYYNYLQLNNVMKLKKVLGNSTFDTSEKNLKIVYEDMKSRYRELKDGDTFKVKMITVPWVEKKHKTGDLTYNEAREKITKAKDMLNNGAKFDEVLEKYADKSITNGKVFDDRSIEEDKLGNGPYVKVISELNENEVSEISEYNHQFVIYKCIQRTTGRYKSFEEVETLVKNRFIDEKYTELLNKDVENIKIKLNPKYYDKVSGR